MKGGLLAVLAHRRRCRSQPEHFVGAKPMIQTAKLLLLPHFVIEVVAEQFSRTGAGTETSGFGRRLEGKRIGCGRVLAARVQWIVLAEVIVGRQQERRFVRGKVEGLDFRLQLQHGV